MKKTVIIFHILFLLRFTIMTQQQVKYFQVDKVKTIQGEIIDIKTEKSYQRNNFIILTLKVKEKTGTKIYHVEVSPEWFFTLDLMKGSRVEVKGSLNVIQGQHLIMTQTITYMGERFRFRDKYGFPLWRGKAKYMKQGTRAKGKRKGHH